MKRINYIFILVACLFLSCKVTTFYGEDSAIITALVDNTYIFNNSNYLHYSSNSEVVNIQQGLIIGKRYIGGDNPSEYTIYFGSRSGILENGKQIGLWTSDRRYSIDSAGYLKHKTYIFREEYFKNGLHDSIYKIYNKEGKVVYSAYFDQGTGLEKDFHENGKLYYEIATKDGYFTDTLKLYNNKGRLQKKLLYKKDSLVYQREFDTNIIDTLENGKRVIITYDEDKSNQIKKKKINNVTLYYEKGIVNLKVKDTLEKGTKKSYQEYINGDDLTKTVYIRDNPKIEYESIKRFSKDKLVSKVIVSITKEGNPIEVETNYDEKGMVIAITRRTHKAYQFITENYNYQKTDYFKSGKKYQWSELIYKEKKMIKKIGSSDEQIQYKELNYYNLKNELIKKEYIKNTSGKLGGGCEGPMPYEIIEKVKTEYFNKNKLVKTEYYENGKLIKAEENKIP